MTTPRRPLSAAKGLLGTEVDELVYDAYGGLVPDGFGATPELLGFWTRCGFAPVHGGTRRNAASMPWWF